MNIPTFDAWYCSTHGGRSFDDDNGYPGNVYAEYVRAHATALAAYTRDQVQRLADALIGGR